MQSPAAQLKIHPSNLELLLERFATEIRYVPPWARLIDNISELPPALRRTAAGCGSNAAWRAWINERCIWFMIGRLPSGTIRRPECLMLHALFFDVAGDLVSSGLWRREHSGRWTPSVA